jgi:hypothetical protein
VNSSSRRSFTTAFIIADSSPSAKYPYQGDNRGEFDKLDKEGAAMDDNGSQREDWHKPTVLLAAFAVVVSVASFAVTAYQVVQNVKFEIEGKRLQADTTAMSVLNAHYKFAADHGIALMGDQAMSATASEGHPTNEETAAQDGLLTADLTYDLTEGTLEHTEMQNASMLLLKRYREDIEQMDYPCGALDDEFVHWARTVVKVNPCQGPYRMGPG